MWSKQQNPSITNLKKIIDPGDTGPR